MFDNPEILLAVLALLAAAVPLAWKWLKTKNAMVQSYLDRTQLDEIAEGAVTEVYQTFVRDLKQADTFDSAKKKEAMDKALEIFKTTAKERGLPELKKIGAPIVKSLLEKAVTRMKRGD